MVSRPTHTDTDFPLALLFLLPDLLSNPSLPVCLECKDRGWLPDSYSRQLPSRPLPVSPRGPGPQRSVLSLISTCCLSQLIFAELAQLPRLTNRSPQLRRHARCSGPTPPTMFSLPLLFYPYPQSPASSPLTVLGSFLAPSLDPASPLLETFHLLLGLVSSCLL